VKVERTLFSDLAPVLAGEPTVPEPEAEGAPRLLDLDGNKILDSLDKVLGRTGPGERIPVIVVFERQVAPAELGFLGSFRVNHTYDNFPFLALSLTPGQVKALAAVPFVEQVEFDEEVRAFMDTASHWFGVSKARAEFGLTGDRDGDERTYTKDDIVIPVLDTGIDPGHVDLDGGKIGLHQQPVDAVRRPRPRHPLYRNRRR